jgi:hypothetical protein
MVASKENKALAAHLKSTLGVSSPIIRKYWDEENKSSIDILGMDDAPVKGFSTHATIGVSDYSIGLQVDDVPLGVEFLIAGGSLFGDPANMIATCAFNVINTKMAVQQGTIFRSVVEMYRSGGELRHILFVPPTLWEMQTQEFSAKKVAWLQAIPISDQEARFADKSGTDALEELFEARQVDTLNLDRTSIV